MSSLEASEKELEDLMGAIARRFPDVTVTDRGGGVVHFRAERRPTSDAPGRAMFATGSPEVVSSLVSIIVTSILVGAIAIAAVWLFGQSK
jgi:hypothetical protein